MSTLKVVTTFPNGSRMVRFYPGLDMIDGVLQLGEPAFYMWTEAQDPILDSASQASHQTTDDKQETE